MSTWPDRHVPWDDPSVLRISRIFPRTYVLGPCPAGPRAAVLVQRCDLRCTGCIHPEGHSATGGTLVYVEALADALLAAPELDGLTISGGDPFLQPAASAALIDELRAGHPELSTMAYTGYRFEWLRDCGHAGTTALLDRLDLLIDGPYVERFHAPLRWRGSTNQRIHVLTERHRHVLSEPDVPAGLELGLDGAGDLALAGIPSVPQLRPQVEALLASHDPATTR